MAGNDPGPTDELTTDAMSQDVTTDDTTGRAVAAPPAPAAEDPARLGGAEEPSQEATHEGFSVRLDNFEGPFDLLLQLISRHKLDITEVALSQVTDEFIAHIKAMGTDWDLDQTSQFVVVGATLLDLKAARLLPSGEVEDPEDLDLLEARDLLFARLLQYRAFKQVADDFEQLLQEQARRSPRTAGPDPQFLHLLPEVRISTTPAGLAELAADALRPKPADPSPNVDTLGHLHAPVVSVREQAELVIDRLRKHGECEFADLVGDSPDNLTTVCRFLALLELFREQAVVFEQPTPLGRLTVRWSPATDWQLTISDEFDAGPTPASNQPAGEKHSAAARETADERRVAAGVQWPDGTADQFESTGAPGEPNRSPERHTAGEDDD